MRIRSRPDLRGYPQDSGAMRAQGRASSRKATPANIGIERDIVKAGEIEHLG